MTACRSALRISFSQKYPQKPDFIISGSGNGSTTSNVVLNLAPKIIEPHTMTGTNINETAERKLKPKSSRETPAHLGGRCGEAF